MANDHKGRDRGVFAEAFAHTWRFARYILLALVVLYVLSGIYSISSNELGVLQRWGRVVDDRVAPGIHYAWPWPVDRVRRLPIKTVKRLEIDDVYQGKNAYGITGDNNLVNVKCVVQYNITDPGKFLFRTTQPEDLLKNLACDTIIRTLARMPVDDVLTRGKQALQLDVKTGLQDRLDDLGSGMTVSFVEISDIKPPLEVERFFSEVVKAGLDRKKTVNDAESYRNQKLSAAKAQAVSMEHKARAAKKQALLAAQGEAQRFDQILARIQAQGPNARNMLHKQAISQALSQAGKVHVVESDSSGTLTIRVTEKGY